MFAIVTMGRAGQLSLAAIACAAAAWAASTLDTELAGPVQAKRDDQFQLVSALVPLEAAEAEVAARVEGRSTVEIRQPGYFPIADDVPALGSLSGAATPEPRVSRRPDPGMLRGGHGQGAAAPMPAQAPLELFTAEPIDSERPSPVDAELLGAVPPVAESAVPTMAPFSLPQAEEPLELPEVTESAPVLLLELPTYEVAALQPPAVPDVPSGPESGVPTDLPPPVPQPPSETPAPTADPLPPESRDYSLPTPEWVPANPPCQEGGALFNLGGACGADGCEPGCSPGAACHENPGESVPSSVHDDILRLLAVDLARRSLLALHPYAADEPIVTVDVVVRPSGHIVHTYARLRWYRRHWWNRRGPAKVYESEVSASVVYHPDRRRVFDLSYVDNAYFPFRNVDMSSQVVASYNEDFALRDGTGLPPKFLSTRIDVLEPYIEPRIDNYGPVEPPDPRAKELRVVRRDSNVTANQ